MEVGNGNEPTLVSDHPSDMPALGILPLQSPPRIQRLQNRRRKVSVDADSDSDSCSMHFPLPTTMMMTPPRQQASRSNSEINEYRRRLEVVKERRARNTINFPETYSEPAMRESPNFMMDYHSTSHEQHYYMPETLEKTFPSSIEISQLESLREPSTPLNESPVSTCQTLDAITRNRNANIGSTDIRMNLQQLQRRDQAERSPSNRTDAAATRRGCATIQDSCVSNDYLNLRHLMCNSNGRNIDTGFAQITDGKHTNPGDDAKRQFYETMNEDNAERIGQMSLESDAFQGPVNYRSTVPWKDRQNGLLDRLVCSNAFSSSPKRAKENHFTSKSPKHYHSEDEVFRDGLPVDRTRSIPSQCGSSFSWVRKQDPWYMTSNVREGSFEEILIEDSSKVDPKVLDHVMHAVVFVRGHSSRIKT